MITGIGIDIEAIARFRKSSRDNHFLRLIFTDTEIKYCQSKHEPYISFAGKFCAKEAVIKANKIKLQVKDIEIRNDKSGKINVLVKGKAAPHILCSISHTEDYAVALAIMQEERGVN